MPDKDVDTLGTGDWTPMSASDDTLDSPIENVTAALIAPASDDLHTISVRGTDSADNTSSDQCITLDVDSLGSLTSADFLNPNPVDLLVQVTLTANVDDSATGNSDLLSAEYQAGGDTFGNTGTSDCESLQITDAPSAPPPLYLPILVSNYTSP